MEVAFIFSFCFIGFSTKRPFLKEPEPSVWFENDGVHIKMGTVSQISKMCVVWRGRGEVLEGHLNRGVGAF